MIYRVAPAVCSNLTHLLVVSFCPFYNLEQIAKVRLDWYVVRHRLQVTVKMFVVFRLLLHYYCIAS